MTELFKTIDKFIRDLNHKRIDFFRYLRVEILRWLLDKPPAIPHNQAKDLLPVLNLGNLVLIRLDDKIGDSITSTGFVKTLLQIKTKGDIIIVTRGISTEIFKNFNDRVKVLNVPKGLLNAWSALRYLQQQNISVLINTSHILTPETMLLSTQIDSTIKINFGRNEFKNFTHFIERNDPNEHVTSKYEKTLKLFSDFYHLEPYELKVNTEKLKAIESHLTALEIRLRDRAAAAAGLDMSQSKIILAKKMPVKRILINSFAGARLRNLSKEKSIELIQALSRWAYDNKTPIQIIQMANLGDQKILNEWFFSYQQRTLNQGKAPPAVPGSVKQSQKEIATTTKNQPLPQVSFLDLNMFSHWVRFPQVTSLEDNIALTHACDLVISVDTSIVHMASALKKKLIAIYRQDRSADKNQKHWSPRYTEFQMVQADYDPRRPDDINTVLIKDVIEAAELFL